MHPQVFGTLSVYFLMWISAATVCGSLAVWWAARAGFPLGRSIVAIVILTVAILVGSKLLYLAEHRFFPFDDYAPEEARGMLHGFRIPGGILASMVLLPWVGMLLRLSWKRFGDAVAPAAALGLVFIRFGCFMNGCCFGKVSSVPWAVRFPSQSWVFWYHRYREWIPEQAHESLPVHPLQLYFLAAAAATFVVLLILQRRQFRAGVQQAIFYTLFFGSTAILEKFRENPLTLNHWLTSSLTVACAAWLCWARLLGNQASEAARTAATSSAILADPL